MGVLPRRGIQGIYLSRVPQNRSYDFIGSGCPCNQLLAPGALPAGRSHRLWSLRSPESPEHYIFLPLNVTITVAGDTTTPRNSFPLSTTTILSSNGGAPVLSRIAVPEQSSLIVYVPVPGRSV